MKGSTKFFLVLLRLAIGWHFLFEGLEKLNSIYTPATEGKRPFSSAGYFREAPGPLGNWMRGVIGDPDEEALARLVIPSHPDSKEKAQPELPPALAKEWDDYYARFTSFYELDDKQRKEAEEKLRQTKSNVSDWLSHNDQIVALGLRVRAVREAQTNKLWVFGDEVDKQRLLKAKSDLIPIRAALLKELAEKTADMKKSLADVLTAEQKARGDVPPGPGNQTLKWIDLATAWSLTVMGGCLLIGFLTRLNCILLAGFLLMTYLAVPAFPWLPVPPNTEGNYYYVNKNLVELLALLVLATTYSGRWLGVDALIHQILVALRGKPLAPARKAGAD